MDQITDQFDCEIVSEMASGAATLVSLPPDKVAEITEGDDDPLFATFVIQSGWSKSKRYWPPEILASISEQINTANEPVVGYMGHIKPDDDPFTFPDIHFQWLKSVIQPSTDKTKMFVKAYVLPGTKAREYLKRKLVRTVSVRGDANLKRIQGGVAVSEFDLESIDLSRPRKAGMKTQLVALTAEMEDSTVKPEEIAALQENELRAHNSALVTEIESKATKPLAEKVSEMEAAAEDGKKDSDLLVEIRKTLGLAEDADVLTTVGELMTKLKESTKGMKDKIFSEVLEKKFKNEATRNLVRRLAVSEMETPEDEDDDGAEDEDKYRSKVEEMVNKFVDEDDDLKALIASTEIGGGRSLKGASTERGTRKIEEGTETENIKVTKVGGRR
jgi:hypothetical protein